MTESQETSAVAWPVWFDPVFYLATYPEVENSGIDPWLHFLNHGYFEGRRPSSAPNHPAWFDPAYYLASYPEVQDSGIDPWDHFLSFGYVEGRRPSARPMAYDFDGQSTQHNCDVPQDPRFTRPTSAPNHPAWFDPAYYLASYPEVQDSGIDPWDHFLSFGYVEGRRPSARPMAYDFDGLSTQHNCDFLEDPSFILAYNRGSKAARGVDHHWYWRFHVGLWCLRTAIRLPGDFVEFGVNYGMLASGGMLDLDWNRYDKHFYLFDSFGGMKPEHLESAAEGHDRLASYNRVALSNGFYATDSEEVRANFAEFHNVHLVVGFVPDTLDQLTVDQVAFVHVDMNNPEPEVLALRFVWDRIVLGGLVLLDDYAQKGFELQKRAMDDLSREIGFNILTLPTGQGLIVKT